MQDITWYTSCIACNLSSYLPGSTLPSLELGHYIRLAELCYGLARLGGDCDWLSSNNLGLVFCSAVGFVVIPILTSDLHNSYTVLMSIQMSEEPKILPHTPLTGKPGVGRPTQGRWIMRSRGCGGYKPLPTKATGSLHTGGGTLCGTVDVLLLIWWRWLLYENCCIMLYFFYENVK